MSAVTVPEEVARRFWDQVDRADGCWLWTGKLSHNGYGLRGSARHGSRRAHRFAYELIVGVIPEGFQLDHLCRVRHCVNPAHLEPVTNQENALRSEKSFDVRDTCVAGLHQLTPDQIYVQTNGRRRCRACHRERVREYEQRRQRRAHAAARP